MRRYSNRVRVSVPNCELVDLVMWVMVVEMRGENMIKFVIMRGVNLSPTSHGLVGEIMFTSMATHSCTQCVPELCKCGRITCIVCMFCMYFWHISRTKNNSV